MKVGVIVIIYTLFCLCEPSIFLFVIASRLLPAWQSHTLRPKKKNILWNTGKLQICNIFYPKVFILSLRNNLIHFYLSRKALCSIGILENCKDVYKFHRDNLFLIMNNQSCIISLIHFLLFTHHSLLITVFNTHAIRNTVFDRKTG